MNFQASLGTGSTQEQRIINASSWSTCLAYCEGTGLNISAIQLLPTVNIVQLDLETTDCYQGTIKVDGAAIAGATSMKIDGITAGNPTPGDLFTVTDLSDSNHKKTYRVTQVETNTHYNSVQPASDERIIHFTPGLQKATFDNSDLVFTNPLIRVIATDVQEYSLNKEGLYSFSLKLEEALP